MLEYKKTKNVLELFIILIALIAILFSSKIVLSQSTLRVAQIADCKGNVKMRRSGGERIYKAVENMSVLKGDTIITGKNSSVNLLIDIDKMVTISQRTQLTISNLVISDIKSHSGRTLLNLKSGAVYVNIKNKLTKDSSFEIKTPTAILGVRGTKFYVGIDIVSVLTGKVMTNIPLYIKKNVGKIERTSVQVSLTKNKQINMPTSVVPESYIKKPVLVEVKLQDMPSTVLKAVKKDLTGVDPKVSKDIDKAIKQKQEEEAAQDKKEEERKKNDKNKTNTNNQNIKIYEDVLSTNTTTNEYAYRKNSDGTITITKYKGSGGNVEIPSEIGGKKVTSIGFEAFAKCTGLINITIPSSVTSIGDKVFKGCNGLANLTMPNSVTSIGKYAFSNCSGLTNITISNRVSIIGDYAFANCSGLTNITIPNSVTIIGNYIFQNCSGLTNITISNRMTTIGSYAFNNCSGLTNITIPNNVTTIGGHAFAGCIGLKDITISDRLTSIGNNVFRSCKGLANIIIPNNITSIDVCAFYGCSGLKNITIPNGVTSIENSAFEKCNSLSSVYFLGNAPSTFGSWVFKGCAKDFKIHCSAGSTGFTTPKWNGYDVVIGN